MSTYVLYTRTYSTVHAYVSCVYGVSEQSASGGEGHSPKSLSASQCGAWALATLSAPVVYVHHNPPHNNRPHLLHMSTDTCVCRDTSTHTHTHTQCEVPQVEGIPQPHHYTHINTIIDTNTPSNINVLLDTHSSLACYPLFLPTAIIVQGRESRQLLLRAGSGDGTPHHTHFQLTWWY